MGKIFATKHTFTETTYYFMGIEVTRDIVMRLSDAHYWKMCTPERITAAGIEIRVIETPTLVATTPVDYSGPGLPRFVEEDGEFVYFLKQFGDRPAGFELRARISEKVGEIVVLDNFERRNFYCKGYKPEHKPIYADWEKFDLEGRTFSSLVW